MAKTRRGGERPGAGRKPMLSWEERLGLGAEAEERIRKAAEARKQAMVTARNEDLNLREKWARLHDIRARKLKQLREQVPEFPDHLQRQHLRDYLMKNDDVEDATLDVRDAVSALYGSSKIVISTAKLRYGLRREILAALAKDASELLGRPITGRMVERCLEEFRAFARLPQPNV